MDKSKIVQFLQSVKTPEDAEVKVGKFTKRYVVYRMLQALYQRQTLDEQAVEHTKHTNGRGFNQPDARLLSSIAKRSQKYQNLTAKQAVFIVPRMLKYASQLAQISQEIRAAKEVAA